MELLDTSNSASRPDLQPIDCIFCGPGAGSDVLIRENGFDGRQCRECRLIYVSPRPSLAQIIDLYGHDEAYVPQVRTWRPGSPSGCTPRPALDILCGYKTSGDLLEVGAGAASSSTRRKRGFNPFAIEFNGIQAEHMRETLRIPCVGKPLAEDPFPGQAFDVVYHCDVVSHFYDPISDFRASRRALRDDGLVVFETGNIGDMAPRYMGLFRRFQYPDHLFFYSSRNIGQLLEASGFELLAIHRFSILADLWTDRVRQRVRRMVRKLLGKSTSAAARSAAPATKPAAPPPAATGKGGAGGLHQVRGPVR